MTVFIADDSEAVVERLRTMLSEIEGIAIVGQAKDALEAKERILELQPDVVILDIRMPKGSGIEVLKEVKRQKQAPAVIVLTAYPYPQYRRRCLELGAEFFFDKGSEFHKVPEALRQMRQH